MKHQFTIQRGMKLFRRSDKPGSPDYIRIIDTDPEGNYLIRIQKPNGETTFMHKYTISIFYKPARQGELFDRPKTWKDRLRDKFLKS